MRVRIVSPILGLAIAIAALPAVACELHQAGHASERTVTAFLAEHGSAAQAAEPRELTACKPDGSLCAADGGGPCESTAQGTACIAK
jgi:hypothetical protein